MTEYLIFLELESDGRYSVYAPDLPGCASWGNSREEALENIREAMELWIEAAQEHGMPVPKPGSNLAYVKVAS
jgi:predicted RNase H-like HicB family nuclease